MIERSKVFALLILIALAGLVACEKPEGAGSGAAGDGGEVVAYVGDEPVRMEQVTQAAAARLVKIEQDRYDILRATLEGVVAERLLEQQAASREITVDELLEAEVRDKVLPPTEAEIRGYFEQNKARAEAQGMTFENVRGEIEQGMLNARLRDQRFQYVQSLREAADVRIELQPPRFDVTITETDPVRGPQDAPITIVEFADFQCPYCRRAHPALKQVMDEYGDKIRFVFRDFPLSIHPRAVPASEAARCAGDQGLFWEYYENLMVADGDLSDGDLAKRAGAVGLDAQQFDECLRSHRHATAVRAAFDTGRNLGVSGTPAFFVNGRFVSGAKSYEDWKTIIEEELAFAADAG